MAIMIAMKSVSVAEAKNRLPELVHEAERGPIEIKRRGRPVAVLVSTEQYERTRPRAGGILEAAERCRAAMKEGKVELEDAFEGLRDPSPGRDVRFKK